MTDPSSQPPSADAWPQTSFQPSAPQPPAAAPAAGLGFAPGAPQPRYRMTAWRVICGICWAAWTALFLGGAIAGLTAGHVGTFLAGAVLGGLAAWYDYRIWTCKARRLTVLIFF